MVLGVDASRLAGPRVGVGRYYEGLLRCWERQELPFKRVRLFSPQPLNDVPGDGSADGRFQVEVLPARGPGVWWQVSRLRHSASDVQALLAPYTLPPGYRGRAVVSNHGILEGPDRVPGPLARGRSWHFRYSALRADAVIANTDQTMADLVRFYGVPEGKVTVIWPAIDERFRAARNDEAESIASAAERIVGNADPFFLFVGKLSSRRHLPELLKAFAGATVGRPRRRTYHLVLAGPTTYGPHALSRPVERIAEDVGITDRFHHFELLDLETLALLYRRAEALLMPSSKEAFSRPIAEAMASGCPALALRGVALGVPEYISETSGYSPDEILLLADDGSIGSLQAGIERLIEDDELRSGLRGRALRAAATFPSPSDQASRVIKILAEVAAAETSAR